MSRYFVGLGCNLGDRLASMRDAVAQISAIPDVELNACSGVWETLPLGPSSGAFLNGAVSVHTCLDGDELLEHLLGIERRLGRIRRVRWGDRTLDLDLLCGFDERGRDMSADTPTLSLPHPEIWMRDFVLQPLLDIDAELSVSGRSCATGLAALADDQRTLLRCLDDPLGAG